MFCQIETCKANLKRADLPARLPHHVCETSPRIESPPEGTARMPTEQKPALNLLPTPNKMIAIFLAAAVIVALSVVGMFWFYAQLEKSAELRRHNLQVLNEASDLLSALKDAETGQRGFLLAGDAAYLQPYLDVRDTLDQRMASLSILTKIPAARATAHQRHRQAPAQSVQQACC